MGISVGVIGAGQFARSFLPLFRAHPDVDDVRIAEVDEERREREAAKYGVVETYSSWEDMCASDVDAVAIFTQRWTHGEIANRALEAGKHVYSAVPMGVTVEEIRGIFEALRGTSLVYMMGETSYYYPAVVFCRERFAKGEFGRFVYGEGEYLHDMDNGFYEAYQYSGGEHWRETASFPPMLYPTHSVSGVLSVTGAHVTAVSCLGYTDDVDDGVFDRQVSRWANDFSNETALCRTSDGGMLRLNEFRRVAFPRSVRPEVRFSLFGTQGSFEQQSDSCVWQTKAGHDDVTSLLRTVDCKPVEMPELADIELSVRESFVGGFAPVHDRSRLPATFAGCPNGHEGSHQFLADDFVRAVRTASLPPVNAWAAARYTLPGIIAHESAKQGGAMLKVPDFGDPPMA